MPLRIVSLLLLGMIPSFGQDATDSIKKVFTTHIAWGSPATSKPSTATLTLRESTRSGSIVKYQLIANGLPANAVYAIVAWPVTSPEPAEAISGVTLDASGRAVCAGTKNTCKGEKPNDPIEVAFQPVQGEPIRLALVSTDGKAMAAAKLVPLPLRGDDQGCMVEAVLLSPKAEMVWIEASGFPANQEIAFDSNSEGEIVNSKGKTDAQGRYGTALLPFVKGKSKGTTNLKLSSTACSPQVAVPWGGR